MDILIGLRSICSNVLKTAAVMFLEVIVFYYIMVEARVYDACAHTCRMSIVCVMLPLHF